MKLWCCFPCLRVGRRYCRVFSKSTASGTRSSVIQRPLTPTLLSSSSEKLRQFSSMEHYTYVEGVFILDKDRMKIIQNQGKIGRSKEAPARISDKKVAEVRRRLYSM